MLRTVRKVLNLFEQRERWKLLALCTVMVLVALVQAVGVASIMPFMSIVSDPQMILDNKWMRWSYQSLGFESTKTFLLVAGLAVLGIIGFSNAFTAFQHWLMYRFIWRKQHRLCVRLLAKYMREPYTFYLAQNTADLAKNILAEVGEVVNGVLLPLMRTLAQTFVIIFVFALLLMVDVTVALAAGLVLGGLYAAIYIFIRRKQARLGVVRRTANSLRFKNATEALGSIKETKVLGREAEFLRRFSGTDRRYTTANASNAIVRDMPRYALETLAFGGIVLIVLYLLQTREDFGEAVAVVSLYALASYRLMPALQQVFRAIAQVRFFLPALNSLQADLEERVPQPGRMFTSHTSNDQRLKLVREIVLEGIGYRYPGEEASVLKNISLRIARNTSVAFVGSTGSGKTTLVDILLGLLEPQDGTVRVDNVILSPQNLAPWQRGLGYVPQQIYLSDDTVTRNVALGVPDDQIDHASVERAARTAHLHDFILSLPKGYHTVIGEHGVRLSGGQRQRIGIARALYHNPDVLIMDEATSALDGITENSVIQAIRELSGEKTIILVAHRLTTVRECDVIYFIDDGRIVASGTYRDLLRTSLKFRAMAKELTEEAVI